MSSWVAEWFGRAAWAAGTALVLLLVLIAGVWLLLERHTQVRRREQEIRALGEEVRRLQSRVPPVSPERVAEFEQEDARQERLLEEWRKTLGRLDGPGRTVGFGSTEAFFELAAFRSRMRRQAQDHGVSLNSEEAFSFATYATQGPPAGEVDRVLRECRALETLLNLLWDVEPPLALREVRRARDSGRVNGRKSDDERDTFAFEGDFAKRPDGEIVSSGFRLTFVAHTATLRLFLTRVSRLPHPVLVRMITVEPESDVGDAGRSTNPEDPTFPVESWSRFTVTLEWIERIAPRGTDDKVMTEVLAPS